MSEALYGWYKYNYMDPPYSILGENHNFLDNLEDLLKLDFCKTIKKKLKSLKEGKYVRIRKYSSGSDMIIYRLTKEEIEAHNKGEKISSELSKVRKEIRESVPEELLQKESELLKEQRKSKKELLDFENSRRTRMESN